MRWCRSVRARNVVFGFGRLIAWRQLACECTGVKCLDGALGCAARIVLEMSVHLTSGDTQLKTLVDRVLEQVEPELILLFGSRAWGVPREDSDFDVMLVVRTSEMAKQARETVRGALRAAGFSVDVLACTVDEYERRQHDPGLVSYKIAREGRVLYTTGRVRQYTAPSARVRENPPREGIDLWLDRAEQDFRYAELALAAEPPDWEIVSFQAHQYGEKTLNALLAAHGVHAPKTHELEVLLTLLPAEIRDMAGLERDCTVLTSLYPRSRYPDAGPAPSADEGRAAITAARRIRDLLWPWVVRARSVPRLGN